MTDDRTPAPALTLTRRKKIAFAAILAVLLFLVFEIAANIGLRVLRGYDGEHLHQYVYDPYKNILPTPNFVDTRGVRHNSVGFRGDTEYTLAKPEGTYRIFLMGASTAYGLGSLWTHIQSDYPVLDNAETIDRHLEAILADSLPGVRVEVINAAITSTWTHHHLIYLNQTILRYDPDMILFLDGFNDFFHFGPRHEQFGSYGYNLPSQIIQGEPTLRSLAYANGWWWFRKSAAVHVASRGVRTLKQLVTRRPEARPMDVDRSVAALQEAFPRNAGKMHERVGLILEAEDIHAVFMLQPLLILERDRPGMPPIERELFDFNVSSSRPGYEEFMHRAVPFVIERETAMAAQVGGMFLDLSTPFDNVDAQVYTDYAHLTPLGNRLLAEKIAGRILEPVRADVSAVATDVSAAPAAAN